MYALNNNEEAEYTEPFRFAPIYALNDANSSGSFFSPSRFKQTVTIRAKDKLGHWSKKRTQTFIVDKFPPKVRYGFEGNKVKYEDIFYLAENTKLKLQSDDTQSGTEQIRYRIGDGDWVIYNDPIEIPESESNEPILVRIQAIDFVKNKSRKKSLYVFKDRVGPMVMHHFSLNGLKARGVKVPTGETMSVAMKKLKKDIGPYPIFKVGTRLFLGANDALSGSKLFFKLNQLKEKKYRVPLIFKIPGIYQIRIRAIDQLGNERTKAPIHFQVVSSENYQELKTIVSRSQLQGNDEISAKNPDGKNPKSGYREY